MELPTGTKAESRNIDPDSRLSFPAPLILASASPRRRELLGLFGVPFDIITTNAEEEDHPVPAAILAALPGCPVAQATHPSLLAWRKANAACAHAPNSVIIGADTIVVLDGDVLGKPRDQGHARDMLRRLSGRAHTVYTGLAVLTPRTRERSTEIDLENPQSPASDLALDLVATDVVFGELSDDQIDAYIVTGEPLDKAGAYGIQGLGGRFVRAVYGSYTCVVGLPLAAVQRLLAAAGYASLHDPSDVYARWLKAQGKELPPCPPTFP